MDVEIDKYVFYGIVTLIGLGLRSVWKKVADAASKQDIEDMRTAFSGIKQSLEKIIDDDKQGDRRIWTELDSLSKTLSKMEGQVEIILRNNK